MKSIPVERVKQLLDYAPETGVFTWRQTVAQHVKAGAVAGGVDRMNGYQRITLDGICFRAHRVAWVFISGAWPVNLIDHINGDKADNRACNLRPATHSQNSQNMRKRSKKKVSLKGVTPHLRKRGGYVAQINVGGKQRKLGVFSTAEEAYAAYKAAAEKNFGAFAKVDCENLGGSQA